jgi:DNA (cytosine-5)-methyltransferase 1
MENVPELLASAEYGAIVANAYRMGFRLQKAKLVAADYGSAQIRTRAFIMGSRLADPTAEFPPLRTHYNPLAKKELDFRDYIADPHPWETVRSAIGDLPAPAGTEIRDVPPPLNLHFGRQPTALSLQRYRTIAQEGMNRFDLQRLAPELTPACWIRKRSGGTDLFGRLWWDRPSVTIRTEFFKPEKGRYLHPEQHRPITHREAARIQGFPDDFIFKGSKVEIARQIGNAVAVPVAEAIARTVAEHFSRHSRAKRPRRNQKSAKAALTI